MATHTPAWKRLGLKLKYAKELPDRLQPAASTRAHDSVPETSEPPAKRRRTAKDEAVISLERSGTQSSSGAITPARALIATDTTNGSSKPSAAALTGSKAQDSRRKSVTFSQETKQEDGDSRTTIDFPAGSPGSTPRKSKKIPKQSREVESSERAAEDVRSDPITSDNSKPADDTPTKNTPKLKNGKKSKQPKQHKDKPHEALNYLVQHRSSRGSWKFNKIIDVWILNHALDANAISSAHVPALSGYVRGLPENAASRVRLVKECKEVIASSTDDDDGNDEAGRARFIELLDSRSGFLADHDHLEEFLHSHTRAAMLLWAMNETFSAPQNGLTHRQGELPVGKKKKSRTSAPIDISSSSEGDSDSDSDLSDSSDGADDRTDARNGATSTHSSTLNEETSSSGSTSSEEEDTTSDSGTNSDGNDHDSD